MGDDGEVVANVSHQARSVSGPSPVGDRTPIFSKDLVEFQARSTPSYQSLTPHDLSRCLIVG